MYRPYWRVFLVLGMFGTPVTAQGPAKAPAPSAQVRLAKGTPVRVRMDYGVSVKAARVGDPVYLKVVGNVASKGAVIIPDGSRVAARITEASAPEGSRGGALVIEMEYVDTGEARIRLSGSTADRGKVRSTSVNEGVLTVPFGTQKGKNANIEAGTEFNVYTDRDY